MACFAGKRSTLDIDTDDVVQFLLDFKNGPQLVLHGDMIQRRWSHKAKFIGEKGTIEWDCEQHRVMVYTARAGRWRTIDENPDLSNVKGMKMKPGWEWVEPMYLEDSLAFLARLEGGDRNVDSMETGIENLRLVLDGLEASRQNRIWQESTQSCDK